MKNTKEKAILIYYDYEDIIDKLSPEEVKALLLALFSYGKREEITDFEPHSALEMAYTVLIGNHKRNVDKYLQKCETNRQNALKRYSNTISASLDDGYGTPNLIDAPPHATATNIKQNKKNENKQSTNNKETLNDAALIAEYTVVVQELFPCTAADTSTIVTKVVQSKISKAELVARIKYANAHPSANKVGYLLSLIDNFSQPTANKVANSTFGMQNTYDFDTLEAELRDN